MKLVCDFCSSPNPTWEYIIPKGMISGTLGETTELVDDGHWLACDECAVLVDARNQEALIERAPNRDFNRPALVAVIHTFFTFLRKPKIPFVEERV